MKKTILLVITAISLTIFGCKKDSTQKTNSKIAGTWYYTNDVLIQYANGKVQSQSNGGVAFDGTFWMQFNSNGTGISNHAGTVIRFTYSIAGNIITINTPAQTISEGPNNIQIYASTDTATIRTLSPSNLELYFDNTGSGIEDTEDAFLSKTKP